MHFIAPDSPIANAVINAIQHGDTEALQSLLDANEDLATARIGDEQDIGGTLLHVATDWPGHFPHVNKSIRRLIAAGADVNAGITGPETETPLHWAASSNDVDAIDALVDGKASFNSPGSVIAGGDPLENAIGFQQWDAARRLVERGAKTVLGDEAALGLLDRIKKRFKSENPPHRDSIVYSFWNACCAGQLEAAAYLLDRGGEINWIPDWCNETALDGAINNAHTEVIAWLESKGAERAPPTESSQD